MTGVTFFLGNWHNLGISASTVQLLVWNKTRSLNDPRFEDQDRVDNLNYVLPPVGDWVR